MLFRSWTTRSARLLRNSLHLSKGNPHVRGGRVPRNLPCGAGETVLCKVRGRPQLYLPQAQDAGPNGVITVGPTYRHAYECDVECVGRQITLERIATINAWFSYTKNGWHGRSQPTTPELSHTLTMLSCILYIIST